MFNNAKIKKKEKKAAEMTDFNEWKMCIGAKLFQACAHQH